MFTIRHTLTGLCVGVLFAVLVSVAFANHNGTVGFHQPAEIGGWAWSSTIGWISMNCSNTAECATSNYNVQINPNKTLTGYAWSSNVGWIKFGGFSGPSGGGGKYNTVAKVVDVDPSPNAVSWELAGWARACSVFENNCSGTLKPAKQTGGWDGWISLSGSTPDYSVKIDDDTGAFNRGTDSFAWGSMNLGWIDLRDVYIKPGPMCTNSAVPDTCTSATELTQYDLFCGSTVIDCSDPSDPSGLGVTGGTCSSVSNTCVGPVATSSLTVHTFKALPPVVRKGHSTTFIWEVTGGTGVCRAIDADAHVASGGMKVVQSDNKKSAPIEFDNTTYNLECDTGAGFAPTGAQPVKIKLIQDLRES